METRDPVRARIFLDLAAGVLGEDLGLLCDQVKAKAEEESDADVA